MTQSAARRKLFFEAAAIAAHLALALRLRVIAWPEVTTPAYLWSKGLLMYRDIKFVHTPGMMAILALTFRTLGVHAGTLHVFSLVGPLIAHGFLLAATRGITLMNRAIASIFFLSFFYGWNGNSVWPVPIIAALAIPVALELENERFIRAGALIGAMILLKQTSAYLLLVLLAGIILSGRFRRAPAVFAAAALPYFATASAFAAVGAGAYYFRWTLIVPVATGHAIVSYPSPGDILKIGLAFAPLMAWTLRKKTPRGKIRSGWLLATAAGLAMIVLPRFDFMEAVAAVPCLALGAARWMEEGGGAPQFFRRAAVATLGLSFAATIALGDVFDGRILFWDDEPALRRLIEEVRTLPAAPLVSQVWENVLPQTGRLPPGGLYVHPWLTYDGPFDNVSRRIAEAAGKERALVVSQSPAGKDARRVGPYWIERAGDESGASRFPPSQTSRTR